jgi:hypothetical protein
MCSYTGPFLVWEKENSFVTSFGEQFGWLSKVGSNCSAQLQRQSSCLKDTRMGDTKHETSDQKEEFQPAEFFAIS